MEIWERFTKQSYYLHNLSIYQCITSMERTFSGYSNTFYTYVIETLHLVVCIVNEHYLRLVIYL